MNASNNSTTTPPVESSSANKFSLEELALADYSKFYTDILGHTPYPHQVKWCDDLQDNDKVLILAPACHGKTTVSSIGYPIWELAKNRNLRVGIVTATDDLAQTILHGIKDHLEGNVNEGRLLDAYGIFQPIKPMIWNKFEVMIEREGGTKTIYGKDASITVGGAMSSWKGKRLDLIIADDMVDERNADTPEKCRKLIDWWNSTMVTRLEPHGKVKIVGTTESEADFYHDILRNPRGFKIIHDKAILDEAKKKVLCPSKWSYADLANIRDLDYVSFMKHYQNIVVNREAAKLSQEVIERCYNSNVGFYPHGIPPQIREQFKYILIGVDPAWTRNKRSKYSVIITVGIRHDDRRQILDIFRDQVEYDNLFSWIVNKYNMMLPQYVIVESNQLQARLCQEVGNKAIPVIPSFTSGSKNDLDMGIPMLYSLVAAGMIALPSADKISREMSQQFITELLAWPAGQYSDVLMAYYLVEKEIRKRNITARTTLRSAITGKMVKSRFSKRYGLRL